MITAGIFACASLVTLWLLKEWAVANLQVGRHGMADALRQLRRTFNNAKQHTDCMWLLACAVADQGAWR